MVVTKLSTAILVVVFLCERAHGFSATMSISPKDSAAKASLQSRRNLLLLGGTIALAPAAAKAELSQISDLQGPIQDLVSPGHWIGQVKACGFANDAMTAESITGLTFFCTANRNQLS
jgi:hypothetical protein